jgi:glucokinase
VSGAKSVSEIKERLARMEERQVQLYSMVEQSLSNFAELSNRVTALEALKHKALGMIAVIGGLMTLTWELLKETLFRKG